MEIQRSNYFEGVLQLRNCPPGLISNLQGTISRHPQISIAGVEKVRGGEDWYVTNQRVLRTLGRWLSQHYSGQMIMSRRLFTRRKLTSRDVYRVTVLFRYMPRKRGDTFTFQDSVYSITRFGPKLEARDTKTKRRRLIDYVDLPEAIWRSTSSRS